MDKINISTSMIHLTDKEFLKLTSYIKLNYGINLTNKRIVIEGRMSNTLKERGFKSFSEYFEVLFADKSGTEMTNLLNRLTTNHSYFLRELEHFNYLKNIVLPELEKRCSDHVLRIWSAGCSAGQEPYTMAMVIDEYFGSQKHLWDTTILATDISEKVLDKAKRGIYAPDEIKDIPANWMKKYMVLQPDGNYRVCDKILKEVIFRKGNLMDNFTFKKPFDLISCRNVMIYFDSATKDKLIDKFYNCTADGGYLFVGHSEVVNKKSTSYTYVKPAIYKRGGR